jgi:hypothetical protein
MSPTDELSEVVLTVLMLYGIYWIGGGLLRVTGLGHLINRIFERCIMGETLWAKKLAEEAAEREAHAEQRRRAAARNEANRLEYAKLKFMRKP